jgi:glycosyltransferase involved in cell wall biosynthesis
MVQALLAQTLDKERWEWLLVDDIHDLRANAVAALINGSFQFQHLPPREIKPYSATATAVNTGLALAQGELIYFMADYMYLHPRCLERHWQIFSQCGPKVFISGPLLDDFGYHGWSSWQLREGGRDTITRVGGKPIRYKEFLPPIYVSMKPGAETPGADNLLSIWKWPVQIHWPDSPPLDWRMLAVGKKQLAPDIFQADQSGPDPDFANYWWCGANDSAPLSLLREVGGMDETQIGVHGGLDAQLAQRMLGKGARYLFDNVAPAAILPHPFRKPEAGWARR